MLKGIFGMSLRPYRNYKVLKRMQSVPADGHGLRPYRNYKVLKLHAMSIRCTPSLRPYRNYKVLKPSCNASIAFGV